VPARDWTRVDYYAVLGVPPAASGDEIGVAFRALAKQLHPDRGAASESDAERFKAITAAYDVLGDERLRHSYDEVRVGTTAPHGARADNAGTGNGNAPTLARTRTAPVTAHQVPLPAETIRRRAHRWITGGIAVTIAGLVVSALIVHLQVGERQHRAGRIRTTATVVVAQAGNQVRFTTADGSVVQVREPDRVNAGTQRDGQAVDVLYRPDRPTDVLLVESTTARDITLWVVALKMLVGGPVFLGVGIRRLRQARAAAAV
jgi:hypothetical protein